MKRRNVLKLSSDFKILGTTKKSQSAVMTLKKGESSSDDLNTHPHSDQTILLLTGSLRAQVGARRFAMRAGDYVTVKAGTPHRFTNRNKATSQSFSVYSPPAY